ncbi:MAG: GntR family transcriptional regulator [bacterium]
MAESTIPFPRKSFIPKVEKKSREIKGGAGGDHFLINKQSAVPLHIQLKEQVRYAIMSGEYEPGSGLPSIRELTAQLGIHRNTVHRVYLELQASGLLVSRPGKGVFVNETLSEAVSSKDLDAVDALIERFFGQGNSLAVNPITLARLVGQRAPGFDSHNPIVAFVECTAHQSIECARDLGNAFGITVQHLLLDDLRANGGTVDDSLQHLVTSVFHFDEVKSLMEGSGRRVHPVTYDLHAATKKVLREVPPDRKLGFICQDANTEEVIGAQIADRVADGVFIGCANLEAPKHALELINKVDTVILTEPAAEFCIKNCTPEHELLELHFALNPPSVDKVTRTILFEP